MNPISHHEAQQTDTGPERPHNQSAPDNTPELLTKDAPIDRTALANILAPIRWHLLAGRFIGAASAVLAVVPFMALVELGDILIDAQRSGETASSQEINRMILILLGGFSGRIMLYFTALFVTHIADVKLHESVRSRMIDTLSRASLSWFSDRTSGQIRKALQDDIVHLHVLVAHKPVDYTVAIVMPLALGIYAFILDWRLGLLSLALIPIYFGFYAFMMRDMGSKTALLDQKLDQLSGTMVEFISGIAVVKAFGVVGKAHRRYADHAKDVIDFYDDWSRPILRGASLSSALIAAPVVMLVVFGGGWVLVRGGHVTIPEVITVTLIALALPQAMETFGNLAWGGQLAAAAATRIASTLEATTLPMPAQRTVTPADASITFDNVTLRYGETVALDEVNAHLPVGTVTALVGPSGSGKSTLAKLVGRFHDPDNGVVRIGGVDIRELTEDQLYEYVGFVLQDAQLIRASIRDNIALARPEASQQDIVLAAKAAQIHHEILELPHSYGTVLGGGLNLSGGQEQRISIARAILADRPILLLDEATAMTDPESEAEIQRALNALVRDKTVLVIAHRPTAIIGADQIIVLDRGRIDANGTHDELLTHPHYRQLWETNTSKGTQV